MVASYSNTADFLDLLAPSNRAYTTDIGGYTSNFGGTSAAAPYAAGVVAALQQAALEITGSYFSPAQVRSTLVVTGRPIADGKNPSIVKPLLDAASAIDSFPPCPRSDLDDDCDVDMLDYSAFAQHWQETGCDTTDWCGGADLTRNGQVDMYDLADFVEEWLNGTLP